MQRYTVNRDVRWNTCLLIISNSNSVLSIRWIVKYDKCCPKLKVGRGYQGTRILRLVMLVEFKPHFRCSHLHQEPLSTMDLLNIFQCRKLKCDRRCCWDSKHLLSFAVSQLPRRFGSRNHQEIRRLLSLVLLTGRPSTSTRWAGKSTTADFSSTKIQSFSFFTFLFKFLMSIVWIRAAILLLII